ncbi:hypothetical protein [Pseudoalteromonas spongiae]
MAAYFKVINPLDSTTVCQIDPNGTQCDWYFDGEVLNQFQFNLGVMYRF